MNTVAYVFIARGIGITPFRSMLKYLLDTKQKVSVTLFYIARTDEEFLFKDLLAEAQNELGLRIIYEKAFSGSSLKKYVPNYPERVFYISGPQGIVRKYKESLQKMGIQASQIKNDDFTGYE